MQFPNYKHTAIGFLIILTLPIRQLTFGYKQVNKLMPYEFRPKNLFESQRDHGNNGIQKRHNMIHPTILRLSSMHSSRKGQMFFGKKIMSDNFFHMFKPPRPSKTLNVWAPFQDNSVFKEPMKFSQVKYQPSSKKMISFNQKKKELLKKIRDVKTYLFGIM